MRTILAIVIAVGGIFAVGSAADAGRQYKRTKHRYYAAQPRYSREQIECERARHEDPTGLYAGFPCWAREAFGRGANDGRGRR